jgi:hypothetical protein
MGFIVSDLCLLLIQNTLLLLCNKLYHLYNEVKPDYLSHFITKNANVGYFCLSGTGSGLAELILGNKNVSEN